VLLLALLDAPAAPVEARAVPLVRTLREVWRVHYEGGDDGQLRWRTIEELPSVAERMQSPHDPQAHFSMKRQLTWVGYKVHVTETCDDDAAHLVTDVTTCPAMQPDMTSTAGIHACLAAKGLLPAEHFVDSAYVDAGLLAGSPRDYGVALEGPVRGTSSRPARAGQGYDLPHFAIDWDTSGSPARKARHRCPGATRPSEAARHASAPCSAGQIASPVRPGRSAPRQRPPAAPFIFICVRNTRR
jgi:transposase